VDAKAAGDVRSATLATLVSSTSMKVASITTPAIIHGLLLAFPALRCLNLRPAFRVSA